MMTSQILKFADSWKTQKSLYFENETQFLPLVKKFINCTLRTILLQKLVFLAKVTFKVSRNPCDDYYLMLICCKEMLSKTFILFYMKKQSQNFNWIYIS